MTDGAIGVRAVADLRGPKRFDIYLRLQRMDRSCLLVGRDSTTSKYLLAAAFAVFVAVFVLVTPSELRGFVLPYAPSVWTLFLLAATLPLLGAFANDGALVSVALAAAPVFGFYLPLTAFELGYPSESVLWGVGTASTFAVPLGLVGFVVGARVRRILGSVS